MDKHPRRLTASVVMPPFHDNRFTRFARTTGEAFGCDASEAVAVQVFRPGFFKTCLRLLIERGWVLILLAVAIYGIGLIEFSTPSQTIQEPSRLDIAASKACEGQMAVWEGSTVSCFKEIK